MTREMAFAECVLNENEFARRNRAYLTIACLIFYGAIQSHCQHPIGNRMPIDLAHTRRDTAKTDA